MGFKPKLRAKVVLDSLGAADQLYGAVSPEEDLLWPEAAIVLEAHRKAMGAGIMNDQIVALCHRRKGEPLGELVIVLAQGTDHVHESGDAAFLFTVVADGGDVIVGPLVHGGTHEGRHARIDTDVIAVLRHHVKDLGYENTVGTGNQSAALHEHFRAVPVLAFELCKD